VKHTELLKPVRAYVLYRPLMIVSILKKVKNGAEDTVFLHTTYVSQQMSAPIYGMDIFFIIKYFEMAFFAAENEH